MQPRRWFNPSQPQTLQIAVALLYIDAFFTVLFSGFGSFAIAVGAGFLAGAYGIANERRWGYGLGIMMAFLPFVLRFLYNGASGILGPDLINLAFEVALVVALLHPQSREYQRIWFH